MTSAWKLPSVTSMMVPAILAPLEVGRFRKYSEGSARQAPVLWK